jgi:uncharacterized membrane protein
LNLVNKIMLQKEQASTNEEKLALAGLRLFVSVVVGIIGGMLVGIGISFKYTPLAIWDIAAVTFLVWLWLALSGRNAEQTAALAMREDPSHAMADVLLVLASVASLAAVGILLFQASSSRGVAEITQVSLGIVSVVVSWTVVHTVYTLKYARLWYKNKGGIDFNTPEAPSYSDFAYLAFTIGMTFQVADTNLQTNELRKIVLRHALLSYLFGTVIVASAISLILGLGR